MMAALQIIAILTSTLYWYCSKREGQIALPEDIVDEEADGRHHGRSTPAGIESHHDQQSQLEAGAERGHPREVEDL